MMTFDYTVLDVPAAATTILDLQETNGSLRAFFFQNLDATATITARIEHTIDGGSTWEVVVPSFDIAPGFIAVKTVAAAYTGRLRVRASGGGTGNELEIGVARIYSGTGAAETHFQPIV